MSLEKYLAAPADYITEVPSQSDLATPEPRPRSSYDSTSRSSGGSYYAAASRGKKSGGALGPGEIAGIVIGVLAGVGILGALAYFVGYKRIYQTRKATSYKRNEIPDGPSE